MTEITYILPNKTADLANYTSSLASERYRILNPAKELSKHGTAIHFIDDYNTTLPAGDMVFVGKLLGTDWVRGWLEYLKRAKDKGAKIIIDACDWYLLDE